MDQRSNSFLSFIPQNQSEKEILSQMFFIQQQLKMRAFFLRILKKDSLFTMHTKEKSENIKATARQNLSDFIEESLQTELPKNIIPRVQTGDVLTILINESKNGGYDFIALDKLAGTLKKSQINKLVSRSHCPVLLLNNDFPLTKIKKIIVPIDISQTTNKRLFWATYFARQFKATIQIVSALNINMDENKSLARKNAEKINTMLNSRGVECNVIILKVSNSLKHKVILDYIEKENPDMVIIRTHQKSLFADTRIGQFVSEIIHGCKMPVFTVGHSIKPFPIENE